MKRLGQILVSILVVASLTTCKQNNSESPKCETIDINLFTLAQDRDLGQKFHQQIISSGSYQILDSVVYATQYAKLNEIKNKILASSNIENKNDLAWKAYLIAGTTLNAFCTPGGYIYVYTGMIKFLNSEDDFAGVMGHEMGHAALRHSTKSMTRDYGFDLVLSIINGVTNSQTASTLASIASNLSALKYSRCHETEADDASVRYLSSTSYKCNGAASFFQKLIDAGSASPPEFLSTHPNPDNRVEYINTRSVAVGCNTTAATTTTGWASFQNSLP